MRDSTQLFHWTAFIVIMTLTCPVNANAENSQQNDRIPGILAADAELKKLGGGMYFCEGPVSEGVSKGLDCWNNSYDRS